MGGGGGCSKIIFSTINLNLKEFFWGEGVAVAGLLE